MALLFACAPPPTTAPAVLEQPSPSIASGDLAAVPVTPAPLAEVSPTTAPALLAKDYLPFEDIFLRYWDEAADREIECAIEFFSEETGLVQRHFTGEGIDRIEVSQYKAAMGGDNGMLQRMYQKDGVTYFQNFTRYFFPQAELLETLILEPVVVGNHWSVPGGVRKITAVDKRVPFSNFGEFSVLEVETLYEAGGVLTQQYMKNVGLVAEREVDKDGVVVRDLKVIAREKGLPITQSVRFYYVDTQKKTLRYIDRELTLTTNEDLKARFADEWRNVPPDSPLLPLSSDVKIRSMYPFDDQTALVSFTSEFLWNMPKDQDIRLLLLQAVTNTLAGYYQLGRVSPDIDGKPPPSMEQTGYLVPTQGAEEYP